MSRAEVTLTQQKIKQELLRQGYTQKKTIQSEYLKFYADWPYFSDDPRQSHTLWIGRKGEIRFGHRFPKSTDVTHHALVGKKLRRAAKANY